MVKHFQHSIPLCNYTHNRTLFDCLASMANSTILPQLVLAGSEIAPELVADYWRARIKAVRSVLVSF